MKGIEEEDENALTLRWISAIVVLLLDPTILDTLGDRAAHAGDRDVYESYLPRSRQARLRQSGTGFSAGSPPFDIRIC